MKSKRLIGLLLYTALPVWAFSQIKGTIVDIHQQPVEVQASKRNVIIPQNEM